MHRFAGLTISGLALVASSTAGTLMLWIAGATAEVSMYAEPQEKATSGRPAFEVASIRLNKRQTAMVRLQALPGGRLVAENCPLRLLIMIAYDIPPSRISGGPNFGGGVDRYDIEAVASEEERQSGSMKAVADELELFARPGSAHPTREMLQTLLETRFRLKYHWVTEQRHVYALTVDKREPKIKRSAEGSCVPKLPDTPIAPLPKQGETPTVFCGYRGIAVDGPNLKLEMAGVTISELVTILTIVQLPVIDRTGLSGTFDVSLEWAISRLAPQGSLDPDTSATPPPDSSGPSIFTAIKEQLGLKLEQTMVPVRVMVIDNVEKPSEN